MLLLGEFKFNEVDYFNKLLKDVRVSKTVKINFLKNLDLNNIFYRVIYEENETGIVYIQCYKDNIFIDYNDIPAWIKSFVSDYEKENGLFKE